MAEAFRRDNFNMEGIVLFMILVSTVMLYMWCHHSKIKINRMINEI